jgi:hypothetical protein
LSGLRRGGLTACREIVASSRRASMSIVIAEVAGPPMMASLA